MLLTVFCLFALYVSHSLRFSQDCEFHQQSEAICGIKDLKLSFPTASPLFAARMRRSAMIASSSLVNIAGAHPLTLEGFSIISTSILLLSCVCRLGDVSQGKYSFFEETKSHLSPFRIL